MTAINSKPENKEGDRVKETARVIEVDGDKVVLSITRHSACSECKKKCELAGKNESDQLNFELKNQQGLKKGQNVKVEMGEGNLVLAALTVYVLPLLAIVAGYLFGDWLGMKGGISTGETAGIIGAAAFFALAFLFVRFINNKLSKTSGFQPKIVESKKPLA